MPLLLWPSISNTPADSSQHFFPNRSCIRLLLSTSTTALLSDLSLSLPYTTPQAPLSLLPLLRLFTAPALGVLFMLQSDHVTSLLGVTQGLPSPLGWTNLLLGSRNPAWSSPSLLSSLVTQDFPPTLSLVTQAPELLLKQAELFSTTGHLYLLFSLLETSFLGSKVGSLLPDLCMAHHLASLSLCFSVNLHR